jgi:hypothetical protein
MPINSILPLGIDYGESDPIGSYGRGFDLAQKMKKAPLEQRESENNATASNLKLAAQKIDMIGNLLGGAKDQNSYTKRRDLAIAQGIASAQDIPEQYDPEVVSSWINTLAQSKAQLDMDYKRAAIEEMKAGGSTGVFANRLMKEPGLREAYFNKVNASKGLMTDPNTGEVTNVSGYNQALGATEFEKSRQKERGDITGKAQGAKEKKAIEAPNILMLAEEAEKLLPQATSGLMQRGVRAATDIAGVSTNASRADRQLQVIAAALTSSVPRMEGPQSDRDTMLYKQAAGDVANAQVPYSDRIAALRTIKALQNKYKDQVSYEEQIPDGSRIQPSGSAVDWQEFFK